MRLNFSRHNTNISIGEGFAAVGQFFGFNFDTISSIQYQFSFDPRIMLRVSGYFEWDDEDRLRNPDSIDEVEIIYGPFDDESIVAEASGIRNIEARIFRAWRAEDVTDGYSVYSIVFSEADQIITSSGDDNINAWASDDLITSRGGADTVRGGKGNDFIDGGKGNDRLIGGKGRDQVFGEEGRDIVLGGGGDDILLRGGNGNDIIKGGAGSDMLNGDLGNDRLIGGAGDDTLIGRDGNDRLTGGSGADTFVYLPRKPGDDVITDFSIEDGDRLEFREISSNEISVTLRGINTIVSYSLNADGNEANAREITLQGTRLMFEEVISASIFPDQNSFDL